MVGPPSQTISPLCPSLKLLHLHYRRWMRGPDKKSLIVAFSEIVGSRKLETETSFSLRLSFDESLEESHWAIGRPAKKIHNLEGVGLILGIRTPYATIPMSTLLPERGIVSLPFKKAESLHLFAGHSTYLEFFFVRDHMKLFVYDYYHPPPPSSLPCALPLFDAIRVLVMKCGIPSFLAGHTFHKLERCKLLKEGRYFMHSPGESLLPEIGMPVCTRVDVDDPCVFDLLKLPQICELALDCSDPNYRFIWERHEPVLDCSDTYYPVKVPRLGENANLSGLNLLHMKNWPRDGDLISILRSVPLLETLILTTWRGVYFVYDVNDADFFRALLPMDANGTAGQKQTNGEGKALAVLCPRLLHLQIEHGNFKGRPDRVPLFKDIITLRAECGSPLKVFTFCELWPKPKSKFELIGRDGSFTMEESVLAEEAAGVELDI